MKSAAVPLAALGLVGAVWLSLVASRAWGGADAGEGSPAFPELGPIQGVRQDAWYLPDDELLGFVEIPGGPFTMGSDAALDAAAFDIERWSAESAQGVVDVPTFFIGRFEVTVAQYAAFVAATGHRVANAQALTGPPDHPVAWVAWTDALAYARWLGATLADARATPPDVADLLRAGWRVGLPTEAQWEKAARGTDARIYPWGDIPRADRANFAGRATTPVGSFACLECPFGLSDMSGNVWEWTRSPYQPYPYDPTDDRSDLDSGALWVMRGGSFGDPAEHVRVANRGGADPGVRRPVIGFRLALSRR